MQPPPLLSASAALTLCRNCGFPLSYSQLYAWTREGAILAIADPTRPRLRLYSRASLLACLPIIARVITEKRCRRGGAV